MPARRRESHDAQIYFQSGEPFRGRSAAGKGETGNSLAREQAEAETKEQVLKSLEHAASALREKLGVHRLGAEVYNTAGIRRPHRRSTL